jgi:very-short-patch-repair endonuclease
LARIHWTGESLQGDRTAVDVDHAITQVFRCRGVDDGFIVLESALHQGMLRRRDLAGLESRVSATARRWVKLADSHSESGSESALKLILLRLGVPFRQQVPISGVGRVDFLLGDHLVIEVDSKTHHASPYADRKRDAMLSVSNRRVLRFMYSQVMFERLEVESAILSALARLDHRRA